MNTKKQLFKKLEALRIPSQTYVHEPVFTCDEAIKITEQLPAYGPIKNLFLKDKKKQFWLIVALHSTPIQLKELATILPAPELRFAGTDDLFKYLGVHPGSVTPLALINDTEHIIKVILDQQIFDHKIVGVHPLSNDATTMLTPHDLQKFIEACGNTIKQLD